METIFDKPLDKTVADLSTNKANATEVTTRFQHVGGNSTSYSFTVPAKGDSSYYKFGLVSFGFDGNNLALYFVSIINGNSIASKPILTPSGRTVTISLSGTTVTVTLNAINYGGMSMMWMV